MVPLGGVVVELLQLVHHALRHALLRFFLHVDLVAREAAEEEGHRAAAVREDPADIGVAGRGAAEDEARDGARGVGRVLDDRRRHLALDVPAAIG